MEKPIKPTSSDSLMASKETIEELKAQIFQLKSIIDNLPGDIYWKDQNGVYLGINVTGSESLRRMGFLWKPTDIIGKTDYDLYNKETADEFRKNDLQIMQKATEITKEEAAILPSGERIVQLSTKRPLWDGKGHIVGIIGNTVDITYLKKIEEDLRAEKEKAEISNQLKVQFIQNMEHDIRTPFSGVYGLASVLYESFDTLSEADKKEILKDVVDAAGTLLNYCNSILDFAKTELGELPIISKKFNFKNLVERVLAMERAASKFKNLNLMLEYPDEIPHILIGDEYRLQQILINLIGNAIKFTDTGYVSFTTKVAKKEEKNIIIKFIVKDTGIGIPQDKQLLIYEKFTRLAPSNKGTFKGLGLGLSIVKQYIEEMGGEIDLQSEVGKGTTFICTLPFKLPLIDEI